MHACRHSCCCCLIQTTHAHQDSSQAPNSSDDDRSDAHLPVDSILQQHSLRLHMVLAYPVPFEVVWAVCKVAATAGHLSSRHTSHSRRHLCQRSRAMCAEGSVRTVCCAARIERRVCTPPFAGRQQGTLVNSPGHKLTRRKAVRGCIHVLSVMLGSEDTPRLCR